MAVNKLLIKSSWQKDKYYTPSLKIVPLKINCPIFFSIKHDCIFTYLVVMWHTLATHWIGKVMMNNWQRKKYYIHISKAVGVFFFTERLKIRWDKNWKQPEIIVFYLWKQPIRKLSEKKGKRKKNQSGKVIWEPKERNSFGQLVY